MSASALKKVLEELDAVHARGFDPVRLAFIQSMSKRLDNPQHAGNDLLIKKVQISAEKYQSDLNDRRREAGIIVKELLANFPEQAEAVQTLFERCEYKQLEKLSVLLQKKLARRENLARLRDLSSIINAQAKQSRESDEPRSIDDMLYRQEEKVRLASGDISPIKNDANDEHIELQSMTVFRESMKHFNIDVIIDRAINDCPENPGPHNPHMLAIKSLAYMRDLSPKYLRRFAGYIETLLWLEKNARKLSNKKK